MPPIRPAKRKHAPQIDKPAPTGAQKIKAALRQTRRLLAKDNLAPNVRVETERRLKSLEADLAQAETSNKERKLATRYHKVKFFERQKVVRKIVQTKKSLDSAADSKSQKKLDKALYRLRVDLNYIINFPKLKKYVSLFPPPLHPDEPAIDTASSDQVRAEVREWVDEQMKAGILPAEPETQLSDPLRDTGSKKAQKSWKEETGSANKTTTQEPDSHAEEQDEFFDNDGSSDSNENDD